MGNAVTCTIVLDHEDAEANEEAIVAGNTLCGKVIAVVDQEIEPREVKLFVCGAEQAVVEHRKKTLAAARFVFTTFVTLHEKGTHKIQAGTYNFPFSVDLPASLPSSTRLKLPHGGKGICKIEYKLHVIDKLKATAEDRSRTDRTFIVASAPLRDEMVPILIKPATYHLNALRVIRRGCLSFGASIDNAHIGREDNLVISLACRNNATVDVARVHVRLVESYYWLVEGKRCTPKAHERILVETKDVSLPGLIKKKRSSLNGFATVFRQPATFAQSYYEEIRQDLESHENTIRLSVPQDSRDSYNGHLLVVSHHIVVSLCTRGLADNVSIQIPLRIGFPPIPSATMVDPVSPAPLSVLAPFEVDIPFVPAIPIPDVNMINMPRAIARIESRRMGGVPELIASEEPMAQFLPSIMRPQDVDPSLEGLLEEMFASIDDYKFIERMMTSPEWRNIFTALTPTEFGHIIAHVSIESDQPHVALLIAKPIHGGNYFSCAFVVEALKNSVEWNRPSMVSLLLPYCIDILTGYQSIKDVLNEWELTVTDADFEEALRVKSE